MMIFYLMIASAPQCPCQGHAIAWDDPRVVMAIFAFVLSLVKTLNSLAKGKKEEK